MPNLPQKEVIVLLQRYEIEFCIEHYALPPTGTTTAVDIGCGRQPFWTVLEQNGYSYCAVDVNTSGFRR
jgi:hypothetical protein